jgi:hypothetical protein
MLRLIYKILHVIAIVGAFSKGRPGRYYARRSGYRAVRRIFR